MAEEQHTYPSIQLIDGEKNFTNDLPSFLKTSGLADAGFNYNMVAVFGSQSTGKSTLLNKLFGTDFATMAEAQRRQTTKGIWMSRGVDSHCLVMDVEGTDGRERGDDQDFERKSALFSLATSEVIIVNLWEHQVGLYQGANMGLLKTVLEVNLQLFQKEKRERSMLFFVIRDHVGATPLKNLADTLTADLQRLWASISKPEGLEESKIEDYFNMEFTTLPHKILMPEKFDEEAAQLRERFVTPTNSGFVFRKEYHKRIPADGLTHYTSSIWDQIVHNKDLDLPTQQQLLAQYRCDEISNETINKFEDALLPLQQAMQSGKVLEGLGPQMSIIRKSALESFDHEASRYHREVYERKRADLVKRVDARLHVLFLAQLAALHKGSLRQFSDKVTAGITGKTNYDFAALVRDASESAIAAFRTEAESCCIEGTSWTFDEELQVLAREIAAVASRMRLEEMKRLATRLEKKIKQELDEPILLAFKQPKEDMWDKVMNAFEKTRSEAELTFLSKARSFNSSEEEQDAGVGELRKHAWTVLRSRIDEEATDGNLSSNLREYFEDRFRYDEDGVPRVWKPSDDIDSKYRDARNETLKLIPIISTIRLSDGSQPSVDIAGSEDGVEPKDLFQVLSASRQRDISDRFRRAADAVYVEAKRSTISSGASIPIWMYGLMVALGWNEFIAVLRNPVYFLFLALLAAGAYTVYSLNLGGPIERVSRAMIGQVVDISKEKLREWIVETKEAIPVPIRSDVHSVPKPVQVEMKELDEDGKRKL
ncbi:root hair defective 3 GTP-binding protein [Saitoella complicata NRRL Y-17804]|uniref:root hair defective 3 GTP-binding protein n=1 Tax=Saitoella complicata (strain BCRC 22490 / CBS 7301 / JCM 7358 / NBRC 10748 / NRRL Y-17804) TaxID=698492 RepID=UPI0008673381|nr:root hair defective 3 GTP-binding protein [Saitoella complicata NRRL Y-17804]ODQ50180.1 root hair defective 3 GTP-binding protein [Saitoella complicata NRRL Y-17804]